MPELHNPPKDQKNGNSSPRPVRPVFALPSQQARPLRSEDLATIPQQFHRTILDADLLRRRSLDFGEQGRADLSSKLCARLTATGEPPTNAANDPLLWLLRAWRNIWTPPSAPSSIQSPDQQLELDTLYSRSAPSAIQYRVMAAWAYRRTAIQPEFGEICLQICNEVRTGGGTQHYPFPLQATHFGLYWLATARGLHVPVPNLEVGTTDQHCARWEKLGFRSYDAAALYKALLLARYGTPPEADIVTAGTTPTSDFR